MAKDNAVIEDKTQEQVETKTFKVIAENGFTYDRKYKKGHSIELSDKKTIENLLTNKLIK